MRAVVATAAAAALMIAPAAASARPSLFAVSSETACLANRNVNPFLRANHANVMRLILSPEDASLGAGSGCVEDAHAAGFRVYISLQFNNHWTPSQVAAYVARVLPAYAPFVWAVGVGNEQDLSMASAYGQGTVSLSRDGRTVGQNYRAVWNAVEPVLLKLVPRAIRVYGEFSPWGFSATEQGFTHGRPPGVQAIAKVRDGEVQTACAQTCPAEATRRWAGCCRFHKRPPGRLPSGCLCGARRWAPPCPAARCPSGS